MTITGLPRRARIDTGFPSWSRSVKSGARTPAGMTRALEALAAPDVRLVARVRGQHHGAEGEQRHEEERDQDPRVHLAQASLPAPWPSAPSPSPGTIPTELAGRARDSSGLDFLRGIISGELPTAPIQELLGFSLDEADEGRVVFSLEPGEQHYNPIGSVHGGVAATLLDSAMGAAVHSTLPQGSAYATLEVKFNLVRAITAETGRVVAEGKVIHARQDGRHRRGEPAQRRRRQAARPRHLHLPDP